MTTFEEMRVVDLKVELKNRGLPVSGLKAALIQRLYDYDGKTTAAATPTKEEATKEKESENGAGGKEEESAATAKTVEIGTGPPLSKSGARPAGAMPARDVAAAAPVAGEVQNDTPVVAPAVAKDEGAAAAAAADVKSTPGPAALSSAKPAAPVVPAPVSPHTRGGEDGEGGGGADGAAEAAATEADDSNFQIKLAKWAGIAGLAVSAACIGWGAGLTAGNLVVLHVALAGLFVAATAANTRPTGRKAFASRALATVAVALVVSDALQQYQQHRQSLVLSRRARTATAGNWTGVGGDTAVATVVGREGGMAALLALVREEIVAGPPGDESLGGGGAAASEGGDVGSDGGEGGDGDGDGDGEGEKLISSGSGDEEMGDVVGDGSEQKKQQISENATSSSSSLVGAVLAWGKAAWSVAESGRWRSVRFGAIEFWGWASVAGYVTLVEALPVILLPLHGFFRRLERGHNISLAVTSAAMLIGIIRSCITSGKTSSVHLMLCGAFDEGDPVFDVTSKTFFWSKAWEWFDTALLVAKGKPVSWLQYTHHASTAILTALNMVPTRNAMWSVVCSLNSFVHTWMYAYYGFPRFGLLRRSKVWLTWAQMLQHMTVLVSATYVIYLDYTGAECYNNTTPILAGLGLYLMYLVFFALFYRRTYVRRSTAKDKSKAA